MQTMLVALLPKKQVSKTVEAGVLKINPLQESCLIVLLVSYLSTFV